MRRVPKLRCRACGRVVEAGSLQYCERCFGPLDVVVEPPRAPIDRAAIESGPRSIWRYWPLLPHDRGTQAGWTPLTRARALGEVLGLEDLWLKDDTRNPTGSFKDRLVATAIPRARELGARVLACASTGNLARAVGVAARTRGMDSVILVPVGTPVPGAIQVEGGYDAVNRLSVEAAMRWESWAWVNVGLRPFYVEGAATLAYETAEQLGWRVPDHVLAPIASGASMLRLHRAFGELAMAGLLDEPPTVRVSAAQPAGCAPVAAAFASGADDIRPVRPATMATSLAMGDPPDGPDLLRAVRDSGGAVEAVPEDEIVPAITLLAATEGIVVEAAGGVAIAALRRLASAGVVRRDERVVVYLTAGPWSAIPADSLGVRIQPTVEALAAALPESLKGL